MSKVCRVRIYKQAGTLMKKKIKLFSYIRNSDGIGRKVIYKEGLPNILYEEKKCANFSPYEAVGHRWLCTRSLNFLIYEENCIILFFISVLQRRKLDGICCKVICDEQFPQIFLKFSWRCKVWSNNMHVIVQGSNTKTTSRRKMEINISSALELRVNLKQEVYKPNI